MSNISQIERIIAQAAEQQRRIERLYSPTQSVVDKLAAHHRRYSHLTDSIAVFLAREQAMRIAALETTGVQDLTTKMEAARAAMEKLVAPYDRIQEVVRAQYAGWERMRAQQAALVEKSILGIPQLSQSTRAWEYGSAGLLNRLQEVRLAAERQALAARLMAAPAAYTEFVQRTTDRLATAPSEAAARALRASINLAESQLLDITESLCTIVAVPEDEEAESSPRDLFAPYQQQEDLLEAGEFEDEDDTAILIELSPAARSAEFGRQVLALVTTCNEACKTAGLQEIFKPTTRLLEVFAELPWLLSTDKRRFGDLVDCLYFIFYEGAGKDNLRYMKKHGGPLEDGDCDLVWCIKHLRNKWTRHDADHGKDRDIEKSWRELAAKFRWLQLAEHPTEGQHFRAMHHKLLEEAVAFLKLIISKMTLN